MNQFRNCPPTLLDPICITISKDTEVVRDKGSHIIPVRLNHPFEPPILSNKFKLAVMPDFLPVIVRAVTSTGGSEVKGAEAGEWAVVAYPLHRISVGSKLEVSSGKIVVEGQPSLTSFAGKITSLQGIFQSYFLFRVESDVTHPRPPSLNLFVPVEWTSVPWFVRAWALIGKSLCPPIGVAPPPPPQERLFFDNLSIPDSIINLPDNDGKASDAGVSSSSGESIMEVRRGEGARTA